MTPTLPDDDRARLLDLLDALRDGDLAPADEAELHRLVTTYDEAARLYTRHMQLVASLRWRFGAVQNGRPVSAAPVQPAVGLRFGRAQQAVAAALLLAAAAVVIYLLTLETTPPADTPPAPRAIATVLDFSGTLLFNDDPANPGRDYGPGTYTNRSGAGTLMLTSGASVTLRGPTDLVVHHDMLATLTRGRAVFDCPPEAKGYTLELPHGVRLTDLGTRFSASIDDAGPVDVRVHEGVVELHRGGQTLRLTDGDTATVTADSMHIGRIIARYATEFPTEESAAGSTRWRYLTCTADKADAPAAYEPLNWNKGRFTRPDWGALGAGDVYDHRPQDFSFSGANHGRFVIAAFTVRDADAGRLAIADSTLVKNVSDDSIVVRIAVNDRLVRELTLDATTDAPADFDTDLGVVNAGDTVYVLYGGRPDWMSGTFYHDFSIVARDGAPADSDRPAGP